MEEGADVPLVEKIEEADRFLDHILDGPFLAIVISPEGVRFYKRDDLTKDDLRQMMMALSGLIEGE